MASWYYYQNPFRFSFHIKFGNANEDQNNKNSTLHKKARHWSILVVVVKWRYSVMAYSVC